MENRNNIDTYLSEGVVTEILARLPLRSISRFKLVCRTWKSVFESLYFRRLFVSLHQNKSISWSLPLLWDHKEYIDFHGCETWGLPKSLGSYISNTSELTSVYKKIETSNGLVMIDGFDGVYGFYVGNPILQQWIVVPYPPNSTYTWLSSLVTRVDEDGVVLSFKVVRIGTMRLSTQDGSSICLSFYVYSSETGIWTWRDLYCPYYLGVYDIPLMTMHGTLYISPVSDVDNVNKVLIAHDFYGESNVCMVIPLPDNDSNNDENCKGVFTKSTGFVMYIKTLAPNVLKLWKLLNSDDDLVWELVWETQLQFISFDDNIINYATLTMHPYDPSIVYFWSPKKRYLVSYNLETHNYRNFSDQSVDDDLHVNHSLCEWLIEAGISFNRFQYVLPRWMASIPRPPKAEILDTTPLLSHIPEHRRIKQSDRF